MDEGPDPEGDEPTETNLTGLQNCKISSHYRHVASVGIPKWARFWTAVEQRRNESADIPALLDRNLSYARRPQHRRTLDPLAGDDHALLIDVLHPCSRHNRHAELFEPLGSFFG